MSFGASFFYINLIFESNIFSMQALTEINYDGDSIAIFDANSLYLVFDCVQTTSDLYYVLNGLDAGNEKRFIELISNEKLLAIIPFEDSLEKICKRYLSDEDSKVLKKKYKEALAQVRSEQEKNNYINK